jgi:hypothetical protein
MGLAISIGFLSDMRQNDAEGFAHFTGAFERLSKYLEKSGLKGYVEPVELEVKLAPHTSSFPYSFIHYLRRAFAHARTGVEQVPPCPKGKDPANDPLIDDELTLHMDSHLVCHSDAEGFYVPVDFEDVLYPDEEDGIAGGMVGSSYALLRELRQVAPVIGIPLENGAPKPEVLAALAKERDESTPLWRERLVWLTLWVKATASVQYKTAIVFC